MTRNLKALGLALAAVFAMSAVVASSALAVDSVFTPEGGPATLDITEIGAKGSGANALTAFGAKTECFGTTYQGHKVGSTTEGIETGTTTATITPAYNQKECRAFNPTERFATITTNGCDFVFHLLPTDPVGTYPVSADVVCPNESQGIHVTVYNNAAHTEVLCTLEVTGKTVANPNQNQGLKGAHVANEAGAKDDLRVTGTFTGIHVERTGLCTIFAPTTTNQGEFHLDATVKGTDAGGNARGVTVSD